MKDFNLKDELALEKARNSRIGNLSYSRGLDECINALIIDNTHSLSDEVVAGLTYAEITDALVSARENIRVLANQERRIENIMRDVLCDFHNASLE